MKKTLIALFATASVFAGVSAASAADGTGSNTGQMKVQVTLSQGCTVNFDNGGSNVTIDFGTISSLAQDVTQEKQFKVDCRAGKGGAASDSQATSISLNAGDAAGSTVAKRLLAGSDGTSTLPFQVYQGSTGTAVWGDGTGTDKPFSMVKGVDTYKYRVVLLSNPDISGLGDGLYQNTMVATVNYGPAAAQ